MNMVDSIRNEEQLNRVFELVKGKGLPELLFLCGMNFGLRISDMIDLKVGDVRKSHVRRREQKTSKQTIILINPSVQRRLNVLLSGRKDDEPLLMSRQRSRATGQPKAITRQRGYQIVGKFCRMAGCDFPVGNHTLRKTFGYWHYQRFHDVVFLMRHFNHSDQNVTLRYIGVWQDQLDDHMKKFKLGC
ncbi:tyrosine-type recombinase/integrase [Bacillota bacterium Meth-B3]